MVHPDAVLPQGRKPFPALANGLVPTHNLCFAPSDPELGRADAARATGATISTAAEQAFF